MAQGIPFYPSLVGELVSEHRKLLRVFGEMLRCAKEGDATSFLMQLPEFKRMLVAHLLKEAVRLYIYLRQKLRDDENSYQLITAYKKEMDGIGVVAMGFIDKYSALSAEDIDCQELYRTLGEIGKVLLDRIRREESELYTLYHDAY